MIEIPYNATPTGTPIVVDVANDFTWFPLDLSGLTELPKVAIISAQIPAADDHKLQIGWGTDVVEPSEAAFSMNGSDKLVLTGSNQLKGIWFRNLYDIVTGVPIKTYISFYS